MHCKILKIPFCRLLDQLVSKVRKPEDICAIMKQVGARHAEGGYGVTREQIKSRSNTFCLFQKYKLEKKLS